MRPSVKALCAILLLAAAPVRSEAADSKDNDWLIGAKGDEVRFKLLQEYLRGFDQPMWEVGERYQAVYEALSRKNFELASYHWEKIRTTIKNGYLKRPARQANAEALLLKSTWAEVDEAFRSKNEHRAWAGFGKAKAACMACHVAERVPFMNDQRLFELSAPVSK